MISFDYYQSGLPRQHGAVVLILRCVWTAFDYVSGPEMFKKFDELAVGGVIHCRMYMYPEGPKQYQKWKMRSVMSLEDSLKCIPYPDPTSTIQSDPVHVLYRLPDYVFTTEKDEIKVGIWDED